MENDMIKATTYPAIWYWKNELLSLRTVAVNYACRMADDDRVTEAHSPEDRSWSRLTN